MSDSNLSTGYLAENHDAVVISVAIVFSVFSILTVIARLVSKKIKKLGLKSDDWLLVAAWVCTDCRSPI